MIQPSRDIRMPVLPLWLMVAGALPFIACAFLLVAGVRSVGEWLAIEEVLVSYTLVIGIFLCGIHWGQQLAAGIPGLNLYALSNVATLLLWFGWLLLPIQGFLLLALVHFWLMWGIDYRLLSAGYYRPEYFSARTLITTIVSICLLAALLVS